MLDAAGWSSCRVLGISFGGMVAQELAVTWPERVERLVLACTSPGGAGGSSYPLHELAELPDDERAARMVVRHRHPVHAGVARRPTRPTAPSSTCSPGAALRQGPRANSHRPRPPSAAGASWPSSTPGATTTSSTGCHGSPVRRSSRAAGTTGSPRVANGEAIAARVPGAELRLYEGGHTFFLQDAAALPEILDFLAVA